MESVLAVLSVLTGVVLPFLVVITILVFVHEMGHFLVARLNGVRVEAFSIGMGPEVVGRTARSGTRWKFCALPIGGYVKMFGDADIASRPAPEGGDGRRRGLLRRRRRGGEEAKGWAAGDARPLTEEERAQSFHHKRVGQRFAIVLAGPVANFVFTIAALYALFVSVGQATTPPVVGAVLPGSAAEEAGLAPGDELLSVDGERIDRFQDLQRIVQLRLDREMALLVRRAGGGEEELLLTPRIVESEDLTGRTVRTPRIGVSAEGVSFRRLGPVEALPAALVETWEIAGLTVQAVGQMIGGRRSADELGGPVRIAELSGRMAEFGVASMIWFMAVLSLNLGIINLMPIPVLDGGHLMFYAWEWARGRPLDARAQEVGYRVGLALVLALFAFVFWNDLSHYWGG